MASYGTIHIAITVTGKKWRDGMAIQQLQERMDLGIWSGGFLMNNCELEIWTYLQFIHC
jgi:hypothetical protein